MRRAPYPHLQRGNILFLILLAVVLFAALTYAITGSQRGGVKDISDEKADLLASQIIQQATNIQQAVLRLKTTGGCTDAQISFQPTASTPRSYANANAPADKHCHIFDPAGAGVPFQEPPAEAFDPALSGQTYYSGATNFFGHFLISKNIYIPRLGTDGGPTGTDLVILYPYLRSAVCTKINQKLGTPSNIVWNTGNFDGAVYDGAFQFSNYNPPGSPPGGPFHSMCHMGKDGSGGDNQAALFPIFYHVLLVR